MSREVRRARILVAEDDPAILELVTIRLELAGHHVIPVRDGGAAIERAKGGGLAAAVLDVNMPRRDGFAVLRAFRADPALARTPVLMLTARNAPADVARALTEGADDYMAKPFDDKQLIVRVNRLVARGRAPARAAPADTAEADDAFLI